MAEVADTETEMVIVTGYWELQLSYCVTVVKLCGAGMVDYLGGVFWGGGGSYLGETAGILWVGSVVCGGEVGPRSSGLAGRGYLGPGRVVWGSRGSYLGPPWQSGAEVPVTF